VRRLWWRRPAFVCRNGRRRCQLFPPRLWLKRRAGLRRAHDRSSAVCRAITGNLRSSARRSMSPVSWRPSARSEATNGSPLRNASRSSVMPRSRICTSFRSTFRRAGRAGDVDPSMGWSPARPSLDGREGCRRRSRSRHCAGQTNRRRGGRWAASPSGLLLGPCLSRHVERIERSRRAVPRHATSGVPAWTRSPLPEGSVQVRPLVALIVNQR